MKNIERDIINAEKLINNGNSYDNQDMFNSIYPFTNENIAACLKYFNLKDKECLTILGSSDQALDMYLSGAKKVDAFDVNPLTKYYFYLKKAALLSDLSRDEYLKFFCYDKYPSEGKTNESAFNEKTFNSIVTNLSGDSYKFWSSLFEKYSPLEIRRNFCLFTFDELSYKFLIKTVGYLDNQNYEKLKEIASSLEINFKNCDISELPSNLDRKYDFIYLSNVIQYIDNAYNNNPELSKLENKIEILKHYKELMRKLSHYLNSDGNLVCGYIYDVNEYARSEAIFNRKAREEVFGNSEFVNYHFEAISDIISKYKSDSKDTCLVYKK